MTETRQEMPGQGVSEACLLWNVLEVKFLGRAFRQSRAQMSGRGHAGRWPVEPDHDDAEDQRRLNSLYRLRSDMIYYTTQQMTQTMRNVR